MTVGDLIEQLAKEDQDLEVYYYDTKNESLVMMEEEDIADLTLENDAPWEDPDEEFQSGSRLLVLNFEVMDAIDCKDSEVEDNIEDKDKNKTSSKN